MPRYYLVLISLLLVSCFSHNDQQVITTVSDQDPEQSEAGYFFVQAYYMGSKAAHDFYKSMMVK